MKKLLYVVATLLLVAALYFVETGESPFYRLQQLVPAVEAAQLSTDAGGEAPVIPTDNAGVSSGIQVTPEITPVLSAVLPQSVIRVGPIATLPSGRTIDVYQSGTGTQVILIIGDIHGGNEQNTNALIIQLISDIQNTIVTVPANVTIYMIPTMNPDGLALGISDAGRLNGNGIDLNRNWPSNNWTPSAVWGNTTVSGGITPFSETETQTVSNLILLLKPRATVFFHCCIGNGVVYANDYAVANGSEAAFRSGGGYIYNDGDPTVTGDAIDWMNQVPQLPGLEVELPVSTHQRTIDWEANRSALQALFTWAAFVP